MRSASVLAFGFGIGAGLFSGSEPDLRLVISTADRLLYAIQGSDTIARMPVGVASGRTITYNGRRWSFGAPRGERRVVRKLTHPVWTPPDWHYAETARNYGLRLARLPPNGVVLSTGARLEIRDNVVGIVFPEEEFAELPVDEHIVFDGRLFIPPIGTENRRVPGHLGRYALDLGRGYLIHGTADESSVGQASTHGCIRVRDTDLVWLYENVRIGTRVTIQ